MSLNALDARDTSMAVASPNDKLNVDTMRMIFEYAVIDWESQPIGFSGRDWPALYNTVTAITAVCRDWRQIALASPHIWRNVMFDIDQPYNALVPYFDISLCLTRTKATPFRLWIYGSASIYLAYVLLSGQPSNPMSRLESLFLSDRDTRVFRSHSFMPQILNVPSPMLKHLCLNLGSSRVSERDMLTLLTHHRNIMSLQLENIILTDRTPADPTNALALLHLTRLSIVHFESSSIGYFMCIIDCPNLTDLTIFLDQACQPAGVFLTNRPVFFPKVRTVSLGGFVHGPDLEAILLLVPYVYHVRFFDPIYGRDTVISVRLLHMAGEVRAGRMLQSVQRASLWNVVPGYSAVINALMARDTDNGVQTFTEIHATDWDRTGRTLVFSKSMMVKQSRWDDPDGDIFGSVA